MCAPSIHLGATGRAELRAARKRVTAARAELVAGGSGWCGCWHCNRGGVRHPARVEYDRGRGLRVDPEVRREGLFAHVRGEAVLSFRQRLLFTKPSARDLVALR